MRGLAFPSNAAFVREASHDYGSPFAAVDNIPIDPALTGPVIDPAIMGESGTDLVHVQVSLRRLVESLSLT
jgi:NAD-dependent oxidoreductase involved in siderophore biosynthesis